MAETNLDRMEREYAAAAPKLRRVEQAALKAQARFQKLLGEQLAASIAIEQEHLRSGLTQNESRLRFERLREEGS